MSLRVYLASSYRNPHFERVRDLIRSLQSKVYDFKHPLGEASKGFRWDSIDTDWQNWSIDQYAAGLNHPYAINGFARDQVALESCNVCILLTPCGRSAHLEAGFAQGAGKYVIAYITEQQEPELMYGMVDQIVTNDNGLITALMQAMEVKTIYPPRRSRIPQAVSLLQSYVWGMLPTDQQIEESAPKFNNDIDPEKNTEGEGWENAEP